MRKLFLVLFLISLVAGIFIHAPETGAQNSAAGAAANANRATKAAERAANEMQRAAANASNAAPNSTPRRPRPAGANTAANAVRTEPVGDEDSIMPEGYEAKPARSTVRGRVFYEDSGRPVKRASIMLVGADGGMGPGESSALTDGDGNFVMQDVSAGSYLAVVNAPGVVSPMAYMNLAEGPPSADRMEEAIGMFEKIRVDGVNETFVQIAAKRGGAINGRAVYENGDPAIGVRVEALRKSDGRYLPVISNMTSILGMFTGGTGGGQTDDRGIFRFPGLPSGEYIVRVSESAQHTNEMRSRGGGALEAVLFGGSSFLTFYYPDAGDPKDAEVINVLMGQELGEIVVVIKDKSLYRLGGKVLSAKDKKPVVGASVLLQKKKDGVISLFDQMGKGLNTVTTDENGEWSFKELPKGEYSVVIEPRDPIVDDAVNAAMEAMNAAVNGAGARRPEPKGTPKPKLAKAYRTYQIEDQDKLDNIVELGFGAYISGTVSVENDQELPQSVFISAVTDEEETIATASIYNYSEEGPSLPGAKNKNSQFKMEAVPSGKFNFRFSVGDSSFYVKNVTLGQKDLMTGPLEVKDGETLTGVKIILSKDVGTLKGTVTDDENKPVNGVGIILVPTDSAKKYSLNHIQLSRSEMNGEFTTKLPPGEYHIIMIRPGREDRVPEKFNLWMDEATKNAQKVTIEAGKTETVKLKKPAK